MWERSVLVRHFSCPPGLLIHQQCMYTVSGRPLACVTARRDISSPRPQEETTDAAGGNCCVSRTACHSGPVVLSKPNLDHRHYRSETSTSRTVFRADLPTHSSRPDWIGRTTISNVRRSLHTMSTDIAHFRSVLRLRCLPFVSSPLLEMH